MNFIDGAFYPENQEKLVITVAPYGPQFAVSDFPEDIPVTMEQQVQKAVDCYEAGATVLHLHVRRQLHAAIDDARRTDRRRASFADVHHAHELVTPVVAR